MTIDGICLRAVVSELRSTLINGRLQKINQINKNLVVLTIYTDKSQKLVLSSNSQGPRIHISDQAFSNPPSPSNFTMVLRKHLINSRLRDVKQNGLDRTVELIFDGKNELGLATERRLVIDLMGRQSNIVLIDETRKVIEAITRVSHDMSRVRAIYPGTILDQLESDKIDILESDTGLEDLDIADNMQTFKVFYSFFTGFSPVMGREICYRADIDPKRNYGSLTSDDKVALNIAFTEIRDLIRNEDFNPNLIYQDGRLTSFYCMDLAHLGRDTKELPSMSQVLDYYYLENSNDDSLNQNKKNLLQELEKLVEKRSNKLDLIRRDLEKAKDFDKDNQEAEVLSANIFQVKKGMKEITLLNYYTNEEISIGLDPKLDPWQNVEKKYKKSKKHKRSYNMLLKSIPLQFEDCSYLKAITRQIDHVTDLDELGEIREELVDQGYLKDKRKKKQKKRKNTHSKPYKFLTVDGSTIFVGKNNRQNEQITLKMASKEDYFFHVKDLPGSHVILTNDQGNFTENDLRAAGFLAAKYSKFGDEKYLDVDYTKRKNVFKAKGAKPGMVYYNDFKTMRVNLEEKISGIREVKD